MVFQKTGEIPRIPKGMVKPTIVAGINSLGRGQDVQALGQFLQTIAQTMGPEAIAQYINPEELIKRLAAAQGIDVLNLVKSVQDIQQQEQQQVQQQAEMEAIQNAPQMAQAQTDAARLQMEQQQQEQPPEA